MPIDMRQFHQTFFEESLEGLADMEAELLRLEPILAGEQGTASSAEYKETLNTIFRAVHSIKGASGTFGYTEIADFTHVLETLMDAVRDERCPIDQHVVNLLLQSVDRLREMLVAAKTGNNLDKGMTDNLCADMRELYESAPKKAANKPTKAPSQPDSSQTEHWRINFHPHTGMFRSGNDPVRILRELATLGELSVKADMATLPDWNKFDPESCYLAWTLELHTNRGRAAIDEIFSWVIEDCDLKIEAVKAAAQSNSSKQAARQHMSDAPSAVSARDAADNYANSIRVSIPKVDALINMVGELVITQAMLSQVAEVFTPADLPKLLSGISQLERTTRDLQESVMGIRMMPIGFVFNRLPRLVRDISHQLDKRAEIRISGERTELDKTVIERMSDPLLHIVRNCMDHGIEPPAERLAAGKPETGIISLNAYQKGGNVVIEIKDNGRGLQRNKILAKAVERGIIPEDAELTPEQIDELIFAPGLSTVDTVSEISGRGVGMDVVRSNIRSLGGSLEVISNPGQGMQFLIRLPLTLAILEGLSVQVGGQIFILPLVSICESICIRNDQISRPANGPELFSLRQEYLPLIRLHELFHIAPRSTDISQGILVVVEADGRRVGLLVDDLLNQQQVVIKNLEAHYRKVDGISAATIMGDGSVALILDVGGLTSMAHAHSFRLLDAAISNDGPALNA